VLLDFPTHGIIKRARMLFTIPTRLVDHSTTVITRKDKRNYDLSVREPPDVILLVPYTIKGEPTKTHNPAENL